ncbi:MAG TPA: hypothetical protein VMR14_10700 [Streptosporangiaceae bacterium]|jgi:hypothetical protein|nr:hypothetical protein [Streptosporangiaceae bacterium]
MYTSTRATASDNSWAVVNLPGSGAHVQAVTCQGTTLCLSGNLTGNLYIGTRA